MNVDLVWDIFSVAILMSPICIKLVVQWSDSHKSGWRRLALRYAAREIPSGQYFDSLTIALNAKCYQRITRACVSDNGLYLSLSPWNRIFHRPLLIPWTQMKIVPDGWNTIVQVAAPNQPVSIEMPESINEDVILQVGRHSPYWLPEFQFRKRTPAPSQRDGAVTFAVGYKPAESDLS